MVGSLAYVRTTIIYGTPTYPVKLEVAGIEIFDGPMDPKNFGRQNDLPRLERFTTFWTSWHHVVNSDSPGGYGPLFALALVVAALFGTINGVVRRDPGRLFLGLIFWSTLFIPEHHVPRYATYILLPGVIFAALMGTGFADGKSRRAWAIALLLLQLYNTNRIYVHVNDALRWARHFHLPLMTRYGNRPIFDSVRRWNPAVSATPETRRALYGLMNDGETLVTAVQDLFAVHYDRDYRYRVEHRPAKPWAYGHNHILRPRHGIEEGGTWLEGLVRDGVDALLVYQDSAEDQTLRATPGRFTPVYTQSPDCGGQPVVIYRRVE
jgi:hypothetical protein